MDLTSDLKWTHYPLWFLIGVLMVYDEIKSKLKRICPSNRRPVSDSTHLHQNKGPTVPRAREKYPRQTWEEKPISPQKQSSFLSRIPLELRLKIYKCVVSGGFFPLELKCDWVLTNDDFQALTGMKRPRWSKEYPKEYWYYRFRQPSGTNRILSLPLTSRQVYEECIDLIYQSNTFAFSRGSAYRQKTTQQENPNSLDKFDYLLTGRAICAIRHLQLEWALPSDLDNCRQCHDAFYQHSEKLLSFKGLQKLRIILSARSAHENRRLYLQHVRLTNFNVRWIGEIVERLKGIDVIVLLPDYLEWIADKLDTVPQEARARIRPIRQDSS